MCYKEQSPQSLNLAIKLFEEKSVQYDKSKIRNSSFKFSKKRFKDEFKSYIDSKCNYLSLD